MRASAWRIGYKRKNLSFNALTVARWLRRRKRTARFVRSLQCDDKTSLEVWLIRQATWCVSRNGKLHWRRYVVLEKALDIPAVQTIEWWKEIGTHWGLTEGDGPWHDDYSSGMKMAVFFLRQGCTQKWQNQVYLSLGRLRRLKLRGSPCSLIAMHFRHVEHHPWRKWRYWLLID